MSIDLTYDPQQRALVDAVRSFCERHCTDAVVREAVGEFPKAIWEGLAEMGVLGLATPEGGGGALEVAAAMEELGRANCPGPLATTFFAMQVLPEEDRAAVAEGTRIVSVGTPPLMPWGTVADLFVEVSGKRAWRAHPRGPAATVETTVGEPWGRLELERDEEVPGVARASSLADVGLAAYLAGAGDSLIGLAADHARDRRQFGRPIGEFQAVAHPLADSYARLLAARHLARIAAFRWDNGDTTDRAAAAAARLSATRAALEATYRAHQTWGALGYTVEGPIGLLGQRVRQVSLGAPGPAAARAAMLEAHSL